MRSCPTCGDQAPAGAQFCICCGAVMAPAADGPTQRISAGLAGTGPTQHLLGPLPRWLPILLLFGIDILILYGVLILWPAYESGMAWFVGNQFEGTTSSPFDLYEPWYSGWLPPMPTEVLSGLRKMALSWTILLTFLAARFLLLPLGLGMLLWLRAHWSSIPLSVRLGALLISVVEIVVVPMTWAASWQFFHWFIN